MAQLDITGLAARSKKSSLQWRRVNRPGNPGRFIVRPACCINSGLMQTHRVRSWSDFVKAVDKFRSQYGMLRTPVGDQLKDIHRNPILFRGQARSSWQLATTLERKVAAPYTIRQYFEKVIRGKNELETFTGQRWDVPVGEQLEEELSSEEHRIFMTLPGYEYLVYLRHHGYPSPLLDWTESPYIAAYFAFVDSACKSPAVYCYVERPHGRKGGMVGEPQIRVRGPLVTSHRRHFAQRAWYTVATRWDYETNQHIFCPHDQVFDRGNERQDVALKIVFSDAVRAEALSRLSDFNINHFTLFQSEDALVKALEHRYFDLNEA